MKTKIFGETVDTKVKSYALPQRIHYLNFTNLSGSDVEIFLNGSPTSIVVTSGRSFEIPLTEDGVEITDNLKVKSSANSKFYCFVLW